MSPDASGRSWWWPFPRSRRRTSNDSPTPVRHVLDRITDRRAILVDGDEVHQWIRKEGSMSTSVMAPRDNLFSVDPPAKGEGFTFRIKARVRWHAHLTHDDPDVHRAWQESVEDYVERRNRTIRAEISGVIRNLSRRYLPHQAPELEENLNDQLRSRRYERTTPPATTGIPAHVSANDKYLVHATVHTWVDVCPEVRAQQQAVSMRLTKAAGDHALAMLQVRHLQEMRQAWLELFLDTMRQMGDVSEERASWLAGQALKVAQTNGKDASRVLQTALNQRQAEGRRLVRDLQAIIGRNKEANLVDFAFGHDRALRQVLLHLGLPVEQIDRVVEENHIPDPSPSHTRS